MLSPRSKVMIVEDARENRVLLETLLGEDYDLVILDSAEACLEYLLTDSVDLILLDVGLPGMNGYEACRELKRNQQTRDIPIVFVSAAATATERLEGYEAGAEGYVAKPFAMEELLQSVEGALRAKQDEDHLKQNMQEVQQFAQQALVSSTELRILNLFMQQSGHARSFDELADNLLRAARGFGLQCAISVHASVASYYFGCAPISLEAQLLDKHRTSGQIVDGQARTILNGTHCSLLVKNMPSQDEARYERLKHHLSSIVDAASLRVESLQYMLDMNAQRTSTIKQLMRTNEAQLVQIRSQISQRDAHRHNVTKSLLDELQHQLMQMGLEENQERQLVELLGSTVGEINTLPDIIEEVEASFSLTKQTLSRLL